MIKFFLYGFAAMVGVLCAPVIFAAFFMLIWFVSYLFLAGMAIFIPMILLLLV